MTRLGPLDHGTVQRVRDAANIATVIQGYTPLRKVGQELVCKCLFHNERTPSMAVNAAKQLYHCHSCSVGGDVIDFIRRIEGLSFPAAVRSLAEQYGINIDPPTETQKRQQVLAARVAGDAVMYWQHVRRVYERQFEGMKKIAFRASDASADQGMEEIAQHYARRAWRWGRAVRRLDAMTPVAAARGYSRVRSRPSVMAVVRRGHEMERATMACAVGICRGIVALSVDEFTENRVCGIVAAGYGVPVDAARGALGA